MIREERKKLGSVLTFKNVEMHTERSQSSHPPTSAYSSSEEGLQQSFDSTSMRQARTSFTDPTTPRCRAVPLEGSSGASSLSSSVSGHFTRIDTTNRANLSIDEESYFPIPTTHSVPVGADSALMETSFNQYQYCSSDNQFHLPSLLHLVGLNLRMALLPPPVTSTFSPFYFLPSLWINQEKSTTTRGLRWIGNVTIFGIVFSAGLAGGAMLTLLISGARLRF